MIWKNKSPSPGANKRVSGKALSTKPKEPCSISGTHLLLACCPLTSTHVAVACACIFTCARTNNCKNNNSKQQQQHSSPQNRDDIEDKPQRRLSQLYIKKRTENQTLSPFGVCVCVWGGVPLFSHT